MSTLRLVLHTTKTINRLHSLQTLQCLHLLLVLIIDILFDFVHHSGLIMPPVGIQQFSNHLLFGWKKIVDHFLIVPDSNFELFKLAQIVDRMLVSSIEVVPEIAWVSLTFDLLFIIFELGLLLEDPPKLWISFPFLLCFNVVWLVLNLKIFRTNKDDIFEVLLFYF